MLSSRKWFDLDGKLFFWPHVKFHTWQGFSRTDSVRIWHAMKPCMRRNTQFVYVAHVDTNITEHFNDSSFNHNETPGLCREYTQMKIIWYSCISLYRAAFQCAYLSNVNFQFWMIARWEASQKTLKSTWFLRALYLCYSFCDGDLS